MKKLLILSLFLGLTTLTMSQWVQQATGFAVASRGINHVSAVNANVVWAAAYDGSGTAAVIQEFTRTINGGNTWVPGVVNNASGLELAMIYGLSADVAYAPMFASSATPPNPQGIYVTTNGGVLWTRQTTAVFDAALGGFPNVVHFWNANDGFCQGDPVGGYYELYTTSDGGTTWTRVPQANIPVHLSGEYGIVGYYSVVGDTIWYGTNKGRVYRSVNKGLNWTFSQTPLTSYVNVYMANHLEGLAQDKSATGSALYKTVDGGLTWTQVNYTGTLYTNDLAYVPGTANTYVSTGAASGVSGASYSFDGGQTWDIFMGTEGTQFLATAWVDVQNGWAGAFNDQTMPSTVGGMYKYMGILIDVLELSQVDRGIVAYPNPSNGQYTFAVKGFENVPLELTIRDLSGRVVYSSRENQSTISYTINIDLTDAPSGFYLAEISSGEFRWTEKLIKQ